MPKAVREQSEWLRERLSAGRAAFICGPSQVGKSACCESLTTNILDWNDIGDRFLMMRGADAVVRSLELARRRGEVTVALDNLHGNPSSKGLVRRLLALGGPRLRLMITSLDPGRVPGRHMPAGSFLLRIHPFSVGECARPAQAGSLIQPPVPVGDDTWQALLEHGGFPEPFRKRDARFTRRWHARRQEKLLGHDLPTCAPVRDPSKLQMLAILLASRSGTRLVYSDLSRELGVAVDTVRRWVAVLVNLQYGFLVRPWHTRIPKAIRKEPKWFLRDWSAVADPLARARTLVACHLLKAADGWTDRGLGRFEVRYVGDKLRREADFLLLRDRRPWFLVELAGGAAGAGAPSAALRHFQKWTRADHAFHAVLDAGFAAVDCFEQTAPAVVPARTLLSQLP